MITVDLKSLLNVQDLFEERYFLLKDLLESGFLFENRSELVSFLLNNHIISLPIDNLFLFPRGNIFFENEKLQIKFVPLFFSFFRMSFLTSPVDFKLTPTDFISKIGLLFLNYLSGKFFIKIAGFSKDRIESEELSLDKKENFSKFDLIDRISFNSQKSKDFFTSEISKLNDGQQLILLILISRANPLNLNIESINKYIKTAHSEYIRITRDIENFKKWSRRLDLNQRS